jgi:hypothetical protein
MEDGTLVESSYFSAAAALRKETLWERGCSEWKLHFGSHWFWAAEVGSGLGAALLTKDESGLYQALAATSASAGVALLVWLVGFGSAPYLWRRDARELLPPFDDNYQRASQRLRGIQLLETPPDDEGTGTAFEALFQLHPYLATGVTVAECAELFGRIYGSGEPANENDEHTIRISFIAELSMLRVVRREGDRFYLTDFGKEFLDRHMMFLSDLEVAADGTLALAKPS